MINTKRGITLKEELKNSGLKKKYENRTEETVTDYSISGKGDKRKE